MQFCAGERRKQQVEGPVLLATHQPHNLKIDPSPGFNSLVPNPLKMMEPPIRSNELNGISPVVALTSSNASNKRKLENDVFEHNGGRKVSRTESEQALLDYYGPSEPSENQDSTHDTDSQTPTLQPYPYFYYKDYSTFPDPDPLIPLTSPGRVPNFPAKMHSILSRADLADVVAWMPHGRSWRVLKPREFELTVIPTYFEHAKFSSFIRQANGWGFRRITQGRDRNAYYHELFLRGLPHLCKMMKRPGVSEKQTADAEHEPDLFKISEERPVPDKAEDDAILLQCTLNGGPKARMPIYMGNATKTTNSATSSNTLLLPTSSSFSPPTVPMTSPPLMASTGYNDMMLSFQSDAYSTTDFSMVPAMKSNSSMNMNYISQTTQPQHQHLTPPHQSICYQQGPSSGILPQPQVTSPPAHMTFIVAPAAPCQNQAVTPIPTSLDTSIPSNPLTILPLTLPGHSDAAAQFAAGFAAATALSNQNFRQILGQAMASLPMNNNGNEGQSGNNGGNNNTGHQQPNVVQQGCTYQQTSQHSRVLHPAP